MCCADCMMHLSLSLDIGRKEPCSCKNAHLWALPEPGLPPAAYIPLGLSPDLFQDQAHDIHALLNFSVPSAMKTVLSSPGPGLHTEADTD